MQYPAYDSYKPSSVDWIDKVPAHWETWKVTHGFGLIGSGTTPKSDNQAYYEEGQTAWITTSELREAEILDTKFRVTEEALNDYSTLKVYKPGALAFAMYGATIGRLGMLGINATVNQACCVFDDPEQFHTKFFFYWLWMRRDVLISLSVGGGQPNLSQDDLKQIRAPIPSVEEQQKIAAFLDYKTQQIDQLIEKKKALIEKLEEKRIAVITQAVTKGLDKSAKLKPSGVDWLGDVPEYWDVMQFKDRCRVVSGQVDPKEPEFEIMPLIAPDHIEKNSGRIIELISAKDQGAISGKYLFQEGDILYSKIRPELNKLCIAPSQGLCSADMYAIRTEEGLLSVYLFFMMLSKYYFQYAVLESMRVAMPKINRESLGAFKILVPPINEQEELVKYIKVELNSIEKSIDVAKRSVITLEEYRSAIITSAVTGKIDVREVEIPKEPT